jgi:hypothetical protein
MMIMAAIMKTAGIPLEWVGFMRGVYTVNFNAVQAEIKVAGKNYGDTPPCAFWKPQRLMLGARRDCPRSLASEPSILQQQREP